MKKRNLIRLTQEAYGIPHLITSTSLERILSYLDSRNMGLIDEEDDTEAEDESKEFSKNGLGYIEVHGAITYKPVYGMCGEVQGASYIGLFNSVESLVEQGCKTIVLDFSSPGGQASHIQEYSDAIRKLADENDVSLIAYVDEMACSAAYWLACMCDEVIANPDAVVGSIGVVVALTDFSKAMDNAGIKRVFITAGSSKVPFDESGAFKKDFLDKIQKDVNLLNEKFASHVSNYTGLSTETIKELNAESFSAEDALEIGLINSILTHSEFAEYIATKHKQKGIKDNA